MLDSSVLIAAERQRFDLENFVEEEAPMEPLFLSSITVSELLHGVHRAPRERRAKRESFVEAVIKDTPTLPFDLSSARRHAELWAKLAASGEQIGPHDMLIAATCLRFDLRLATLNEGEFGRIDGLELANARQYAIT